jgi:hypothetical protein
MKRFVIPVMSGATGIVTKGQKNIWKNYPEEFNRFSTTHKAVIGTSHTGKVLQSET